MNIGDKVRLLHGKEEGIVRKILNDRLIEVEIDEGFLIPVLKNEVVLIAGDESSVFNANSPKTEIFQNQGTEGSRENEGIFLGVEYKDQKASGWIINNTSETIMFSVHDQTTTGTKSLSHGILNRYSYAKVDDWPADYSGKSLHLIIDIIRICKNKGDYIPPFSIRINLHQKMHNQEKKLIPLLNLKGILLHLNELPLIPDPEEIKEAMFKNPRSEERKDKGTRSGNREIDLHIESLADNYYELDSSEILHIQLLRFEENLDRAVIEGEDQITFIHGIGNGTLRNMIHKKLSQYPHIRYFEDAMKEKFGYGATKVYLK